MDKIMMYGMMGFAAIGVFMLVRQYNLKDKIFKRAAKYAE